MWQGMEVHEMTSELEVALEKDNLNKFGEIPAGSFIVMGESASEAKCFELV